ncbi:MAG: di-heme enzyme [Deltaproteobacteria bacterium]
MRRLAILLLVAAGCGGAPAVDAGEEDLRALLGVPDHMALPPIPDFNVPTAEKIELGRWLFYEKRLSANETQACSSCHEQALAFADGVDTPEGSTGQRLVRNSQGLGNAVYHSTLTWSNDGFQELEDQLRVPLTADNPVELGITDSVREEVLARFDDDPAYAARFAEAFPESDSGATLNKVIFALASFLRTMVTGNTPYDRYVAGDTSALTSQQVRGLRLFNGERFECFHCHNGVNFTVSYRDNDSDAGSTLFPFFNTGLYNVGGDGDYPSRDQGLYDLTLDPKDRGLFRPQSLRNVALTAPYMHDGSIATLREVITDHYARGGRIIESGPDAGDGRTNPLKSGLVQGFITDDEEIDALVSFLESLTDPAFVNNPSLSDPDPND